MALGTKPFDQGGVYQMEEEIQSGEPAQWLSVCGGQAGPGVHSHTERWQQSGDHV